MAFVLNDERFSGAKVLLAGPNFGTGSSREHAVWAIMDYGFEAVVSPRFGDIFRNNSTKNGLVPVQVDEPTVRQLMAAVEADPDLELTVDLERLVLAAPALGIEAPFPLDRPTQERFLEGLDDIALSLRHDADIARYEAPDRLQALRRRRLTDPGRSGPPPASDVPRHRRNHRPSRVV